MRLVWALLLAGLLVAITPQTGGAHSELLATSPADGSVVGGTFHSIVFQFSGVSLDVMPEISLTPPPGVEVETSPLTRDGQRVVLPIHPLTEPGDYVVSYRALSGDGDGDIAVGAIRFTYDPDAPEPEAITIGAVGDTDRFDTFALVLLIAGAAVLGYLVHRFWYAWRTLKQDRLAAAELVEEPADGLSSS